MRLLNYPRIKLFLLSRKILWKKEILWYRGTILTSYRHRILLWTRSFEYDKGIEFVIKEATDFTNFY